MNTLPTHPKLPPKSNVVFLRLFDDENDCRLLISLLNSLLLRPPKLRIVELTLLSPQRQGITARHKDVVLDIFAATVMGDRFNVDLQVAPQSYYPQRALYYGARMYQGQLKKGMKYNQLRPAVGVHILDFVLWPDDPDYQSIYELRERKKHRLLTDHMELHMLELPKFKIELPEIGDDAARWLYYLKHGDTMSAAQVKKLGLPEIAEADRKLQVISQDEEVRIQHMRMDKAIRDRLSFGPDWREQGRKEGLAEGLAEGRKEGRKEGQKEGREETLRESIADLCEVLGIELPPRRRQALKKLDHGGLSDLWVHLKTTRSWPT